MWLPGAKQDPGKRPGSPLGLAVSCLVTLTSFSGQEAAGAGIQVTDTRVIEVRPLAEESLSLSLTLRRCIWWAPRHPQGEKKQQRSQVQQQRIRWDRKTPQGLVVRSRLASESADTRLPEASQGNFPGTEGRVVRP